MNFIVQLPGELQPTHTTQNQMGNGCMCSLTVMTFAYAKLLCTLNDKQMRDKAFMKLTTKHITKSDALKCFWCSVMHPHTTFFFFFSHRLHCYNFSFDFVCAAIEIWFSSTILYSSLKLVNGWENTQKFEFLLAWIHSNFRFIYLFIHFWAFRFVINLLQMKIFHIYVTLKFDIYSCGYIKWKFVHTW